MQASIKWTKRFVGTVTVASLAAGAVAVSFSSTPAYGTELSLHAPSYPWDYKKLFRTYDHQSIRRGYQVYKEVCSACHTLKYHYYRQLINVCLTAQEAKADAAENTIMDGPDDNGEMFERPMKTTDVFKNPYDNDELAKLANNGAIPPPLDRMVLAREGNENYIFQLLTSYCDAPIGKEVTEGTHYNPYFKDKLLSMARPMYNEHIEYPDGTPATTSQMAKDVVYFLRWCADPWLDERKRFCTQGLAALAVLGAVFYYGKRFYFSYFFSMKYLYRNRKPPRNI